MEFVLDKRFKNTLQGKLGKYSCEVGVLNDSTHLRPRSKKAGFKSVAGGPARFTARKSGSTTVSEVSKILRKRKDYLRDPFKNAKSKEIINLIKEFFNYAFGRSEPKRLINTLQAVVRNPLARGDYGPNKGSTIRTKGFDRYGIDTGQLFKSIKARVSRV